MGTTNPSFEIEDDDPGEADGWTLQSVCTGGMFAAWGSPPSGVESFDWATPATLDDAARAFFDAGLEHEGFEDFEEGWSNDDGVVPWDDGFAEVAQFDTAPEGFEDFEEGWSNDDGVQSWDDVSHVGGAFDEGDVDDFELTPWSGVWVIRSAETFESGWTPMTTL